MFWKFFAICTRPPIEETRWGFYHRVKRQHLVKKEKSTKDVAIKTRFLAMTALWTILYWKWFPFTSYVISPTAKFDWRMLKVLKKKRLWQIRAVWQKISKKVITLQGNMICHNLLYFSILQSNLAIVLVT